MDPLKIKLRRLAKETQRRTIEEARRKHRAANARVPVRPSLDERRSVSR